MYIYITEDDALSSQEFDTVKELREEMNAEYSGKDFNDLDDCVFPVLDSLNRPSLKYDTKKYATIYKRVGRAEFVEYYAPENFDGVGDFEDDHGMVWEEGDSIKFSNGVSVSLIEGVPKKPFREVGEVAEMSGWFPANHSRTAF